MLEKISPKDADKKVLIKINGTLISIAPFAPPLKPNQPNHNISAPRAAIGVLLPWKDFLSLSFLNLPVLFPIINNTDKAIQPPTEWTTEAPAKSKYPNLPNQPNFSDGSSKLKAQDQWPTIG